MLKGAHSTDAFAGKDIRCAIDLGDEMYGDHGLETGLNYEFLCRFAQDNKCNIDIVASAKGENYIDSLRQGCVDIVITHADAVKEADGVEISRKMDACTAWLVQEDKENELRQINIWISHLRQADDFESIVKKYSKTAHPVQRAEKGVRTTRISPYDGLIRKYAAELGWDWRMLAAVVYQESKFSINSRSHRGAMGLMQVMPSTARHYDIHNLLDPENSLKAGTSHLKRLQKMFSKEGMEQAELIKFTLAAYNAGEGRVLDCRNFAASQNVDNARWDEIVKIIPMMREDSILEEESVKLGKFQGHETIAYINNIMDIYKAFCEICPV